MWALKLLPIDQPVGNFRYDLTRTVVAKKPSLL